jgi:hypothetical protein
MESPTTANVGPSAAGDSDDADPVVAGLDVSDSGPDVCGPALDVPGEQPEIARHTVAATIIATTEGDRLLVRTASVDMQARRPVGSEARPCTTRSR